MNLECKNDFINVAKNFEKGFDVSTVSMLIIYIRSHRKEINAKEAKSLLEIPIEVLKNAYLINPKEWTETKGGYFAGNITWAEESFTKEWKSRFREEFDLNDIIELCEVIASDFDTYRIPSEFLLRNVEVTIRDDINLFSNLNGYEFYEKLMKVLGEY